MWRRSSSGHTWQIFVWILLGAVTALSGSLHFHLSPYRILRLAVLCIPQPNKETASRMWGIPDENQGIAAAACLKMSPTIFGGAKKRWESLRPYRRNICEHRISDRLPRMSSSYRPHLPSRSASKKSVRHTRFFLVQPDAFPLTARILFCSNRSGSLHL